MIRVLTGLACVLVVLGVPAGGDALDPPHDPTRTIDCSSCHTIHRAAGGTITKVAGNANLCQSCHLPGGPASAKPLAEADQALPAPGLPAGAVATGNSHRWDSGPAGHVEAEASNTSPGEVRSGGAFAGRFAKTYTVTISSDGDEGTATFAWSDTLGGGAAGLVTGADVPLDDGVTVSFMDGASSPSFRLNDRWRIYVRPDLVNPATPALAARIADGKLMCSTCHDQHSQAAEPFDPAAPAYGGAGTGAGRHFQRVGNDVNQMCVDCHRPRDVTTASQGSHPVGVPIPAGGAFRLPVTLPLDKTDGLVRCLTCHIPHFGPAADGTLRRRVDTNALCAECHTLADPATASHLDPSSGVLWPGGEYGSTFPEVTDETKRGACTNCHQPHGWPDNDSPTQDFPKLWVERYDVAADGTDPDTAENLCYTCHDGSGPATTDVEFEFGKGVNGSEIFHHPVADSEQLPGRSVECVSCHNPHRATATDKLAGVSGVALDGTVVTSVTAEYQVCFKCHGDGYNTTRPGRTNKRRDFDYLDPNVTAYHPVAAPGRNRSTNLRDALVGFGTTPDLAAITIKCADCHNNEATADTSGPAANSAAGPQGPHGSTLAAIRRADYWDSASGPTSYSRNNFALCYLCHDPARHTEARRRDDNPPARTSFYDGIRGRDNLHWLHLVDKVSKTQASCKECHYNPHGNRSVTTTQYRIDGVLYDYDPATSTPEPPATLKTHLVAFGPNDSPVGGRAKPEWWFDTTTRERRCYVACHGETHDDHPYRPPAGDDTATGDIPP